MGIAEKQLGQLRPANTTAASIYSAPASTTTSIQTIRIANVTASTANYSIFHDNSGTTYDESTALAFVIPIPGRSATQVDIFAATNNATGNFAVQTDTADAITFTVYGAEIT